VITLKRQPNSLITGSLVFLALAVVMAALSGDVLLVLAVGSAVAGVTVLSRPSRKPVPAQVAISHHDLAETRRSIPTARVAHATIRPVSRRSVTPLRSRRPAGAAHRSYAVAADDTLPVIQVLR